MTKSIHIGDVSIPLDSYVISGTALLGTKGAGKTYASKGIAEQLLDHNVPIIVFDPIGRWRFLKIAGEDSKSPRGYKVVVAGGEQPDLPLTPASAAEIVRAAMRENIPLVLDLYDRKLSKADWRRIVQTCFRTILYENKGLRHLFLEETAEFAPQKVLDGETYAEVEKLVRMGGNASVGITLINQRAQEVNKAVLDLCDNLVLMRQRGAHAIEALEKWIDKLDPSSAKAIARAMPTMKAGEAWVFTGSTEAASHVHTGPIRSFHPDRSKPQLTAAAEAARRADPAEFVERLSGELSKLIHEAEANDPAMLRKRIADLEEQLEGAQKGGTAPGVPDQEALSEAHASGFTEGYTIAKREQWGEVRSELSDRLNGLRGEVDGLITSVQEQLRHERDSGSGFESPPAPTVTIHPSPASMQPATRRAVEQLASVAVRSARANGAGEQMGAAERKFLTVLAQRQGKPTTRNQVAIFSGYSSKSRHVDNTLGSLRSSGYATGGGEDIRITPAGLKSLGQFDPLPTGRALRDYWIREAGGAAESAMLTVILAVYPKTITRDQVATQSGYSPASRHVDNTLGRLRSLDLIRGPGSAIRANEDLFR